MSEVITFNTEDSVRKSEATYASPSIFLELVPENDPILKQVMPHFDFSDPPTDPLQLASNLVDTCMKRNGFGLSANQCGLEYRVFVMGSEQEYVAMFNPELLEYSKEQVLDVEGCLSFPLLALKIKRPKSIKVKYQDFKGEQHTANFDGFTARIFLHELDHLNGICYTDVAGPMAKKAGLKKREKFSKLVSRYNTAQNKLKNLDE